MSFRTIVPVSGLDIEDQLPVGLFRTDGQGLVVAVNRAWTELAGLERSEALGDGWKRAVHPEDRAACEAAWEANLRAQRRWERQHRFLHANGTTRRVLCQGTPLRDEEGNFAGYLGTVTDITGLANREERLALALDAASDGLFDLDIQSGEAYFSSQYYTMLGYTGGEFAPSWDSFAALLHPEDRAAVEAAMRDYAAGLSDRHEIEIRMRAKDGSWRWILSRGRVAARDEELRPLRLIGTHVDITSRVLVEQDLRLKDQAMATAITGIAIADYEGNLTYVNPAFLRMWGYSEASEVAARSLLELSRDPHRAAGVLGDLRRQGSWIGELVARRKDGTSFEVQVAATVVADKLGTPAFLMGSFLDVSDAARRERALRESEERLRTLVSSAPVVLFALDADGVFTLSDGRSLESLRLKPGEVVGRSVFEVYRGNEAVLGPVRQALAGAAAKAEMPVEGLDFEVWLQPLSRSDGIPDGLIGVATDVTDRKQMEEERARLASLVDASRDFVGVATPDGEVTYLNRAARSLTGLEDGEPRPRPLAEFFVDGEGGGFSATMLAALRAGDHWEGEARLRHAQGGEAVPVEVQAFPLQGAAGTVNALAIVARDISERHRAEQQRAKLEAQFLQAQKMEALGRLTGGIAHDFNNVLTVILGYTALLKSAPNQDARMRDALNAIEQAGIRSSDLVRQLLGFSRQQIIAPRPLDLNQHLAESQRNLALLMGEDVEWLFDPGRDLWKVMVDPSQLGQVLMNLAVNARDAMPDGGRFSVVTGNAHIDHAHSQYNLAASPGDYVVLSVSDSGTGMDSETMAHLFEPFFTTKPPGKGTGLGLATVYGIVRQNGGFITVDSEPGAGATFRIYIPRFLDQGVVAPLREARTAHSGSGSILLVEDDEMVRKLTAEALASLGFTPLVAENPHHAIALCEDPRTPIDLVITDVVMPEMKGTDLRNRLEAIRPGIKVLFMSGYASSVIVRQGVLQDGVNFLQKPFSLDALAAKVQEVLGDGSKKTTKAPPRV